MSDRLVLVLVGSVDLAAAARLASEWMALDLPWLLLAVHDAAPGGLPASIVHAVRTEMVAAHREQCTR